MCGNSARYPSFAGRSVGVSVCGRADGVVGSVYIISVIVVSYTVVCTRLLRSGNSELRYGLCTLAA